MGRILYLWLAGAACGWGQGLPDPAFDRIPFDQWLKESADAHIRWSAEALPSRLSVHQRLSVEISVQVAGAEFVKRNGAGQIVVFLEIRDRENHVFRTHRALHFDELKNPSDLVSVSFDQYAFVLPGDYQVTAAVLDTKSNEHAVRKLKLKVPELPRDPLPGAWRNLPAVEFVNYGEPPDSWYLPEISSRLSLPVLNEKPVRVEVVVNESPTEATRRVSRTRQRNMGNLIPALRVLAAMDIKNGSLNVTMLDLEQRKVSFHQEEAGKLDWAKLRSVFLESDPNKIDVHALENHDQNAQFFVSEIRKRLEGGEMNGDVPLGLSADPKKVLIVLSGPMAFPKGQDMRPIEATPEPGTKVFYIRYFPPPPGMQFGAPPPGGMGRRGGGAMRPTMNTAPGRGSPNEDSLARTLKPLAPRTFDVTTPMDFRNALAAIMSEISRLR